MENKLEPLLQVVHPDPPQDTRVVEGCLLWTNGLSSDCVIDEQFASLAQSFQSNSIEEEFMDEAEDDIDRRALLSGMGARSDDISEGSGDQTMSPTRICLSCEKRGHCTVFMPRIYKWSGERFGIVGPHWYGAIVTLGLFCGIGTFLCFKASKSSIIKLRALQDEHHLGWSKIVLLWFKPVLCFCFILFGFINLVQASCTNPGIVTQYNNGYIQLSSPSRRNGRFRWCDICKIHQPIHAVHCPDCNVCVAHHDHHCPWIGTCIGQYNEKAFWRFNLCWAIFLVFGLAFVAFA